MPRHRLLTLADEPETRGEGASPETAPAGSEIARLLPPPLIEDLRFLNKQSQNLHAEVLLRRLGLVEGGGSRADGLAIVQSMLDEAGAQPWDGIFPTARACRPTTGYRPAWSRASCAGPVSSPGPRRSGRRLPVGGVDGTLVRRFRGTSLEGRIFAKTGTLDRHQRLSGFMLTSSGEMLIFSAYANDQPAEAGFGDCGAGCGARSHRRRPMNAGTAIG